MQPEISVVMPLFNKESEALRAIRSVISQSAPNFELIIVDDGSTDSGPSLIRQVQDSRIRIFRQENAGVSAARNRGISEARAGVIAFLDADDEWEQGFLEAILRLRRVYPMARVYASRYVFRKPGVAPRISVIRGIGNGFTEGILPNYFRVARQSDPPVWSSAVAVDADAIRAVGCFPVGVAIGEDLLTWARLAARYPVAYCMKPLSNFWVPDGPKSRPNRRPQESDVVGDALRKLEVRHGLATEQDVAEYLGLWHQMRGSICLQWGELEKARVELRKARALCSPGPTLGVLSLISIMPTRMAEVCYWALSRLRRGFHARAP